MSIRKIQIQNLSITLQRWNFPCPSSPWSSPRKPSLVGHKQRYNMYHVHDPMTNNTGPPKVIPLTTHSPAAASRFHNHDLPGNTHFAYPSSPSSHRVPRPKQTAFLVAEKQAKDLLQHMPYAPSLDLQAKL